MGQAALSLSAADNVQRACPLCRGTRFEPWRLGLLACQACHLVFSESVWRRDANLELNEQFFDDGHEPAGSAWVRLFEGWNNRRTLRRLRAAGHSRPGKLLEVGVGSGSFLEHARLHGYEPVGCDLSAHTCAGVTSRTGVSMYCGSLESLPQSVQFDVIVMNHVLEHVAEPLLLLHAALDRLRPGGLLHLAVPNVGSWEARCSGWNSYEPYHLVYFTPRTLQSAVEQAGFDIQTLATHDSFSGWFLAIVRWVRGTRLSPVQESRPRPRHVHPAMAFVYRICMLAAGALTFPLRRLQDLVERGDEVVLVGRHPVHD